MRKEELSRASFVSSTEASVKDQLKNLKKPSFILYALFIFLMLITDVLDLVELTGVGIIVAKIIQIFATIISMLVAWHSGSRIKAINNVHESIAQRTSQITHRLAVYRQRYAKAIGVARRLGVLKRGSTGAKLVLRISKYTKFTRSPVIKTASANILEFIPVVGILPLQTIFAIWTYLDHKGAYKNSLQIIPEYEQAQLEEQESFGQSQLDLYEDIMSQAEDSEPT